MRKKKTSGNVKSAAAQNRELRARVRELEDTFLAIQGGRVDAVVEGMSASADRSPSARWPTVDRVARERGRRRRIR